MSATLLGVPLVHRIEMVLIPPFKWGDTDNKNVKNKHIRWFQVEIKWYGENKIKNRIERPDLDISDIVVFYIGYSENDLQKNSIWGEIWIIRGRYFRSEVLRCILFLYFTGFVSFVCINCILRKNKSSLRQSWILYFSLF